MSEAAARDWTRVSSLFSDDRLARRATGGDQHAFGAIFSRYHQRLFRYCLAVVGNPEDAQDALQNTMVKVLRALPGEERRIDLKPWLYRIAHNESIEVLRRRRQTAQIDPELIAQGAGLAEEAEVRDRLRRLISDLEQLPDRQRGALVMRELAGLDFAEIGTALGTSAAVARQTLYEARLGLGQMEAGREMSCEAVTKALSDADGRVTRRRDVRAHLRSCAECRSFGEQIKARKHDLAALSPLPAVAAAGLAQGLLGGNATGGLATALGGGAAKSLGATAALKGAATVAVVAAVGVTAADRGGLIDAGLPGGANGSQVTHSAGGHVAAPAVGPRHAALGAAAEDAAAPARSAKRASDGASGPGAEVRHLQARQGDAETAASEGQRHGHGHPRGHGHHKQLPSAAQHGQETAAAHKATPRAADPTTAEPTAPVRAAPPAPTQGSSAGQEKSVPAAPPAAGQKAAPAPRGVVAEEPPLPPEDEPEP